MTTLTLLVVAVVNELYTLSSAWQFRRTLLAAAKTVFVPTSPEWSFLASSLVKEVATFGGDVSSLVPPLVLERLTARLAERRSQV